MITIGICDDDSSFISNLYDIINHVMFPIGEWKSHLFHSSKELMDCIVSGKFDCQLLFMDIMMRQGTGFEAAKCITEYNLDTDIIFVTSSSEHVYECFHYHAFAYLLKPITEQSISEEIHRYLCDLSNSKKYLSISFQGVTHQIPLSSILYVESILRKVVIHTFQKDYHCYQKLNDIEEQLRGNQFARCHQSYLIALDKVSSFSNNRVQIQDISIPISARYQDKIKKQLQKNQEELTPPSSLSMNSLSHQRKDFGALICTKGKYLGAIIRFRPEQQIYVGRDGKKVDIVINLPLVSRVHCSIIYHYETAEYEVTDFSNNGIFVNGNQRLLQGESYLLKAGTELRFGDKNTIYKLG